MSPTKPAERLNWLKRGRMCSTCSNHSNLLSTVSWLHHKSGNYLRHGKQGQRGVQEAQTCTESEYHIADQEDFHFAEERKEGILWGFCFCLDTSTEDSRQLQYDNKQTKKVYWNETHYMLKILPMLGKTYMLKGTIISRKHPRSIKGTSYPKDWYNHPPSGGPRIRPSPVKTSKQPWTETVAAL